MTVLLMCARECGSECVGILVRACCCVIVESEYDMQTVEHTPENKFVKSRYFQGGARCTPSKSNFRRTCKSKSRRKC